MNSLRRASIQWLLPMVGVLGLGLVIGRAADKKAGAESVPSAVQSVAVKSAGAPATAKKSASILPVKRAEAAQPRVLTDKVDYHGNQVSVSCATCHSTRAANYQAGKTATPSEFHPGLVYAHGKLSCLSCHNADNYDTLRTADGQPVAYQNALALCGQCHGPQTRDYRNGSHGGMVGYWDQTRGDRDRNVCTDCHDVHAPAYPLVMPVFPPRDRGALEQAERAAAAAHITNTSPHPHD